MTVFNEINKAVEKLTADRKVVQTNVEIKAINKKLKALRYVVKYVKGGSWATKKSFIERVNYVLSHDRVRAAKKFGVSVGSIDVSMSLANKMLVEKLGADIIKQIMSGNCEEALSRIKIAEGSFALSTIVFSDVLSLMPITGSTELNLSSCMQELKFLRGCSINSLKKSVAKVDGEKLGYIINLYNTTTDNKLKLLLYAYINNEDEDALSELTAYINSFGEGSV